MALKDLFKGGAEKAALRTPKMVQLDSAIGPGYVVIEDTMLPRYVARGYELTEDLQGPYCLVKENPS
jgi:hypothetical protein